jgi:hypothetical protein
MSGRTFGRSRWTARGEVPRSMSSIITSAVLGRFGWATWPTLCLSTRPLFRGSLEHVEQSTAALWPNSGPNVPDASSTRTGRAPVEPPGSCVFTGGLSPSVAMRRFRRRCFASRRSPVRDRLAPLGKALLSGVFGLRQSAPSPRDHIPKQSLYLVKPSGVGLHRLTNVTIGDRMFGSRRSPGPPMGTG